VALPLRARTAAALADCVVATGFARNPARRIAQVRQLERVAPHVRDVRCRGAASLELCAVASGELDAYFESDLEYWDVAAGSLIAVESGLYVVAEPSAHGAPLVVGSERTVRALSELLADGTARP
jgi:myo-inositol-1(or 4)-monophosphatase